MSDIKDGGSAFPHDEIINNSLIYEGECGMTLRDYFATKVDMGKFIEDDGCIPQRFAIAIMDGDHPPDWYDEPVKAMQWWFDAESRFRYMKADAMLKARGAA